MCFPPKLLLDKIKCWFLQSKVISSVCILDAPCLCEFFLQTFLSPKLLLVFMLLIEVAQALAIY